MTLGCLGLFKGRLFFIQAVVTDSSSEQRQSLLFRVPNPMALCQNHCALRNGSFVSLQASLLKGIHLI